MKKNAPKKTEVPPERKRYLKRIISKLKLSKAVKDTLLEIALEIEGSWLDYVYKLKLALVAWESLYLDKPEDRLWHASDKTWWRRPTPEEVKKGGYEKWHLLAAEPPPEIKQIMNAVENLKQRNSWKQVGETTSGELAFCFIESASKKPDSSGKSSKKSKR